MKNELELKIIAPTEDAFIKEIKFNYTELKTAITNALAKYDNLVYDETQIKDAKADRATLNKFRNAVEAKRKEIKSKCLEPYNAFEIKVKDLLSVVDKPLLAIDTQVKKYEDIQKAEKKARLETFFAEKAEDLSGIVSFEKIFNERWLNSTFAEENACTEIFNKIAQIKKDLETLSTSVDSTFITEVKDTYLTTLDLGEALRRNTYLLEQKKKQEEYEAKKAAQTQIAPAEEPVILGQEVTAASKSEGKIQQIDFRVWVTDEQKALLKQFLLDAGIKYGAVK